MAFWVLLKIGTVLFLKNVHLVLIGKIKYFR